MSIEQKILLHAKRRDPYLCSGDTFQYVAGSARTYWFGTRKRNESMISASTTANVLGLGYSGMTRKKYMDNLKTGTSIGPPLDSESYPYRAQAHGKKYEAEACRTFLERFQYSYTPIGDIDKQVTYTVDFENIGVPLDHPVLKRFTIGATPDQVLWSDAEDKMSLLEIKCPYHKYLGCEAIDDQEEATALLSEKHYIQCQIQMLVLDIDKMFLFFYVPEKADVQPSSFCTWLIKRDQAYQQFLLSNIYQAYREVRLDEQDRFKVFANEIPLNRVVTYESKREHCTFLIS